VQRFGVARETVRRSLATLQNDGILSKAQGKGWFVGPEQSAVPIELSNILIELRESVVGNFNSGDRFYSENDLAKTYGISRHQARQILAVLTADGLLITKPGTGRFVNIESKGGASD
jgi:DNA-binding GntR family transcriptional regulator